MLKKVNLYLYFVIILIYSANANDDVYLDCRHKCGTYINEFNNDIKHPKLLSLLDTLKGRPLLDKQFLSQSGRFLIHYNQSGYHSVNNEDTNINGIPDFVDSVAFYFDYTYRIEVDSIGYRQPLTDSAHGGSNAYDIYLLNVGNHDEAFYGAMLKDFEVLPRKNFPKYSFYIVMDNDFGPLDSTLDVNNKKRQTFSSNSIDLIKVTAAHEFHHAIQMSYGEQEYPQPRIINEMMSSWIEYRLYPEIKDYLNYIKPLFLLPEKFPFGSGSYMNGYRWSIFGQYIYQNFGDSLLLRTWELVGEGINCYDAMDRAFIERNSTLANEWCNFLPWLYYTGSRAIKNMYFPDAELYPEISYYYSQKYASTAFITEGVTQSFEVRAYRCILPPQANNSLDTLSVIIGNNDLQAAIRAYDSNKPFTLTITDLPGQDCDQIEGTNFYHGIKAPNGNICHHPFFIISNPVNYAYPNPFIPDDDIILNFQVPENAVLDDKALLKIYTIDMIQQYSGSKEILINRVVRNGAEKNDRVVQLNSSDFNGMTNGVYIYLVEYKDKVSLGKFVIKRH